jgi:hypothetical protein
MEIIPGSIRMIGIVGFVKSDQEQTKNAWREHTDTTGEWEVNSVIN